MPQTLQTASPNTVIAGSVPAVSLSLFLHHFHFSLTNSSSIVIVPDVSVLPSSPTKSENLITEFYISFLQFSTPTPLSSSVFMTVCSSDILQLIQTSLHVHCTQLWHYSCSPNTKVVNTSSTLRLKMA